MTIRFVDALQENDLWVRIQAREQGRRLHDEENDIDGKLVQVDVSSLHREAVPQSLL